MKKCIACGHINTEPLGLNKKGEPYKACCPETYYVDITLPELKSMLKEVNKQLNKLLLLGGNDESIVDKKRELQKQIRNFNK
jgi:hypothetical protein